MKLDRRGLFRLSLLALLPWLPLRHASASIKAEFLTRDLSLALRESLGSDQLSESDAITLDLPEFAAHGAVVPITVGSSLPDVESISLLSPVNNVALIGTWRFGKQAIPELTTRIKLAGDTEVMAVAKSNGRLYAKRRSIRVDTSGC